MKETAEHDLRQDWWKPLEEERPATPEPTWSIPLSDVPVPKNNWESALASTYSPPLKDSLLAQTGITELKPQDLKGPAFELVKVFHPNEYLRYGSKGSRPALSISKMKAAYYLDVGLEQMVPDQMWIEEECKYDIAAMYGISHWWFQRQRFYIDRHTYECDRRAIDEALDYRVKEFKINKMNPGLNTRFWTRKDVDRSKEFMFAIQKWLKTKRIFRNLESFIRRRVRDEDYKLLKLDIEKVAVCSSLRSLKPKHTIESRAKRSSKIILLGHYSIMLASSHTVKTNELTDAFGKPFEVAFGHCHDALSVVIYILDYHLPDKLAPKRTTKSSPATTTTTTTSVTNAQLKNSHVMNVGYDVAYAMTWADLKKKVTDKYYSRVKIKKLKFELWNLKVKGTDVIGYNQRFQELALSCFKMFPEESDKIERYIGGLPDMIHGSVVASKAKTMQEAIKMATKLMYKKIRTFAERHYRSDCPELKNQDHGNQAGGTGAHGMVHALEGGETNQDLNDVEDDINA
nr:reverse transcriptase domain-containing protein [Tanacetum cinerariifolium]